MAKGFGSIQRNLKTDAGNTLFEKITSATGGEKKSLSWYRSAVRAAATTYKKDLSKFASDERKSNTDGNVLRRYPKEGHLFMFEYTAKMRHLPYYDKFPLVYVVKASPTEFFGANLHYMNPKKRIQCVSKLMNNRIDIPKKCFHKYLQNHVDGLFLDLAADEWDTAILLPTEDFVKNIGSSSFPYDKELVWEETNESFYDKIKGTRVIQSYGKQSDKEMVT